MRSLFASCCVVAALAAPVRADESPPDAHATPGDAALPCGSVERAKLRRTLFDYCEHDRRADACTCRAARRALQCEPDVRSHIVEDVNGRGLDFIYLHPERCHGWRVYFQRDRRGWRVDSVDEGADCL